MSKNSITLVVSLILGAFLLSAVNSLASAEEGLSYSVAWTGEDEVLVGQPYTATVQVANIGSVVGWDTYVEIAKPQNVSSPSVTPTGFTTYSDRWSWYIYNFQPGGFRTFNLSFTPEVSGTQNLVVNVWYRAESAPSVWKTETVTLAVNVTAPEPAEPIYAEVVAYSAQPQWNGTLLNAGDTKIRVYAEERPGSIHLVNSDGADYTFAATWWVQTAVETWEFTQNVPFGYIRIWFESAAPVVWTTQGPWTPALDGNGIEQELVTFVSFTADLQLVFYPRKTAFVYSLDAQPAWAAKILKDANFISGFAVQTNCEGEGLQNRGSFVWNPLRRNVSRNVVLNRNLADPSFVDGTFQILRPNGTAIYSGVTSVPVCK